LLCSEEDEEQPSAFVDSNLPELSVPSYLDSTPMLSTIAINDIVPNCDQLIATSPVDPIRAVEIPVRGFFIYAFAIFN
jgi:hypothetical protein